MARKRDASKKRPGHQPGKPLDLIPKGYHELLSLLRERIRSAQLRASLAVNREMIVLYWQIGRDILTRQEHEGWGTKVIDRLAADLRHAYPEMTGLSPRNLKYMRAFAEAWSDEAIVQAPLAQITWYHNIALLEKLSTRPKRLGQQYRLDVGGDEFFIGLLFYHLKLRCYVVIDLKTTAFKPEYAGKMNFYLSAVDDLRAIPTTSRRLASVRAPRPRPATDFRLIPKGRIHVCSRSASTQPVSSWRRRANSSAT